MVCKVMNSVTFESNAIIVAACAYTLCDDSIAALPGREFDCCGNYVDHPDKLND